MLRGLGRSPFGPRANSGIGGAMPSVADPPPPPGRTAEPAPATPAPVPERPPPRPPAPPRRNEAAKEVDPAQEQYEALKRHIHMRLVDRLDMNRIAEIDPKTLRNEIRGVVEQLCDTENPLLNRNERQRLVNEILDETFGFGPLELLAQGRQDRRHHDQRPQECVCREGREDLEVGRRLPRQRASASDHRPDRLPGRPPCRRDLADGRCPASRRLSVQRDHPPAGPGRAGGDDPHVRFKALSPGRPAALQGVHARDAHCSWKGP